MVGIIIAASAGASLITSILILSVLFGIYKKRKMSRAASEATKQEKIDLLVNAVKKIAKHNGLDYSDDIAVFDKFNYSQELLEQLKINALAEKGKVNTTKTFKKASKVKM